MQRIIKRLASPIDNLAAFVAPSANTFRRLNPHATNRDHT